MTSSSPTVFIAGATGTQGSSLVKQLRALNWSVHTTVRNLDSPSSNELKELGVELTQGDWDDSEALKKSIAGCSKLYLCLMPDIVDPDHERRQAENICKIAKATGVTQVVSSTSLGASMYPNDDRLVPGGLLYDLLKVKKESEGEVIKAGFDSYTLLRPAYFMANFLEPTINGYTDILGEGTWSNALLPETKLGLVDHDDIASLAVAAFKEPEKFNKREIGIVSEFLTSQETMEVLGEAMGKPLKAVALSDEEINALPYGPSVLVKLEKSMRYMEDYVDMEDLRKTTTLTTFKGFLEREKESVKKLPS